MEKIQLGDKVKCKYTGFVGIAVARSEFINGCVQYSVAPKWDKNKSPLEQEMQCDSQSLEVIEPKNKPKEKKESSGGPMKRGFKQKGF